MSTGLDYRSLFGKMLLGSAVGGLRGAGVNWYNNDSNNTGRLLIHTGIGAGVGGAFDLIRQGIAQKEDAAPVLDSIPEGLYYGEGGLYGNVKGFKGTPINRLGRHGFIAGVFNTPPEGMDSLKLPNGQYAVTFSGIPTLTFGLPNGGFYATINGRSKVKGDLSDIDYRILSSAVNQEAKLNGNYYPKLYPLVDDKQTALEKVKKIRQVLQNKLDKSLGKYNIAGNRIHRNNCLSLAGYLINKAGIPRNRLPKQLGYFGSILSKDIDLYNYDSPTIVGDVKTAGLLDFFNKKNNQQPQTQEDGKGTDKKQSWFNFFNKKTPEEKLKEEFEAYVIRSNPKLWNIFNEKDKYPKNESRSGLISLLGLGIGALYGLGRGYMDMKNNPKHGTVSMLGTSAGYGALGFGLATTGNLLAKGIGNVVGKYGKPRTQEEQDEYDKQRQIYSSLPGFDAYNAQLRKRLQELKNKENYNYEIGGENE